MSLGDVSSVVDRTAIAESDRRVRSTFICRLRFQEHLEKLISLSPSVLHLGHKGATLLARFVSVTNGLRQLSDLNYVAHQLEKWYSVSGAAFVYSINLYSAFFRVKPDQRRFTYKYYNVQCYELLK